MRIFNRERTFEKFDAGEQRGRCLNAGVRGHVNGQPFISLALDDFFELLPLPLARVLYRRIFFKNMLKIRLIKKNYFLYSVAHNYLHSRPLEGQLRRHRHGVHRLVGCHAI